MSEKHYPYIGGSFDRIVFDGDGSVWVPESENAKLRELAENLYECNGSCNRCVELMGKCEYEEIVIDAGTYTRSNGKRSKNYHKGMRCKVCGRLHNVRFWTWYGEPPKDMPLYEVDGLKGLFAKELGEERRVR